MTNSRPSSPSYLANWLESCDTMVALASTTSGGNTVFAKNSDRPQEEAQPLVMIPATTHTGGYSGTQFVDVPQIGRTYRHVGSKPYWCSGYEHGYNEHQVVIGNEALPSLLPESNDPKLVGMEVLRLGLERSKSAAEAVEVVTTLVSKHGQGKFDNDAGVRTYDNIYLIADPVSAYVVECVGHDWAVKKVDDLASISNVAQIGSNADSVSEGAKQKALELGLIKQGFSSTFEFGTTFGDPANSASGAARQCRSDAMLRGGAGNLDVRAMMEVLTDHSDGENPEEDHVVDVSSDVSICLHRTSGDSKGASTASLVADLCATGERLPIYWTGMYSPCMTVFLPQFIEGELPSVLSVGSHNESLDSPWWDFYRLTHHGLATGVERRQEIRSELASIQNELFESAYEIAITAQGLITEGARARASDLLTDYMYENANQVLTKVKSMIPVTSSVS